MKKKIIIIGTISIIIILVILLNNIINNNYLKNAKELFNTGRHYEAIYEYYEKLNSSNKTKIEKIIIDEISNKKWQSEYQMKYTNYNNCIGNEYIEIENNIANHYVICGEEQYDYQGRNKLNISLEEKDNSKILFKLSYSDSLYLFVYRNNKITVATGALNSKDNYKMQYLEFNVVE